MKIIKLLFVLSVFANFTFAQFGAKKKILPTGLAFSNQLQYTSDIKRKLEIMENWLNLDYRYNGFSAGVRFVAFQPNDPDPSISRGKDKFAGIDYQYISAKIGKGKKSLKITGGNFYALFGRGMVLKSYEDRSIRADNNLLGVKLESRYDNLKFVLLSGMAENSNAKRTDILHAADLSYRFGRALKLGATYALNSPKNVNAAKTSFFSIRSFSELGNADFYFEYGFKKYKDVSEKYFDGKENFVGKGFYGNVNYYLGNLSFSGEYKYYDNFAFTSSDGTVFYNTPPSLRKYYSFALLNRHPSTLDRNNEKGFQFDVNYSLNDETSFEACYELTNTLSPTSYYKRIYASALSSQKQFEEIFLQGEHRQENFYLLLGFSARREKTSDTESLTPVAEFKYFLSEVNSLRLSFEHQQTHVLFTDEKYFDDVFLVEFQHSPDFSVSAMGEMQTTEPTQGRRVRKIWGFLEATYKVSESTDVDLLIGSRHAGHICTGGVCRYEPEFNGVELKVLTRIY